MRVLYWNDPRAPDGFSYAERRTWRTVIFNNVLAAIRQVIDAMEEFEIDLEHDNNIVSESVALLTSSLIVSFYVRRKRLKIPRASLLRTYNLYKHCGMTAAFNKLCAEETNMRCTITYTSPHPQSVIPRLIS
jgi:hypothetical protein